METVIGYTNIHAFHEDEKGRIYLLDSGDYLVEKNDVLKTMEACKNYLSHIDGESIDRHNKRLYDKRIEEVTRTIQRTRCNPKNNPAIIYLIRNNRNGYHKIGRTNNLQFREKTLQSEEPELELIHSFNGTIQAETDLHNHFSDKRLRGEWFNLNESDINFIKSNG